MKHFIILLTIAIGCNANGQSFDNLIQMGIAYVDTNPDSAMSIFKEANELDSDRYESWYYISYCYSAKGNFKETVNFAREALARNGDDSNSYALLGIGEILTGNKIEGCTNLEKSIQIDSELEDVKKVFQILCGSYYRVYIDTPLADSSVIDKIQDKIGKDWSLSSIGEETDYLRFSVTNKKFLNYRDNRSFEVEIGTYIFDNKKSENLLRAQNNYKSIISKVNYRSYSINEKELVIVVIDSYTNPAEQKEYLRQRKRLLNELKELARVL